VRKLLVLWLAATLSTALSSGALAQARSGTVAISVAMPSPDVAHVEERYDLTSSLPIELRFLTRPCATIENVIAERGGAAANVTQSRDGPWVTLRDTIAGDSIPLVVRYDVRLAGTGIVPLIHLAAPLARNNAARLGAVSVAVTLPDESSRVSFPHMTRHSKNQWSARYVGVPSFVEIAGDAVKECAEVTVERRDNGGLVWRFFLLLGIMVAWVPLYLAWARRSGESA
jgi:hypothetical protein